MHGAATFAMSEGVKRQGQNGHLAASWYPGGVADDSCPDFV